MSGRKGQHRIEREARGARSFIRLVLLGGMRAVVFDSLSTRQTGLGSSFGDIPRCGQRHLGHLQLEPGKEVMPISRLSARAARPSYSSFTSSSPANSVRHISRQDPCFHTVEAGLTGEILVREVDSSGHCCSWSSAQPTLRSSRFSRLSLVPAVPLIVVLRQDEQWKAAKFRCCQSIVWLV